MRLLQVRLTSLESVLIWLVGLDHYILRFGVRGRSSSGVGHFQQCGGGRVLPSWPRSCRYPILKNVGTGCRGGGRAIADAKMVGGVAEEMWC